MRSECTHPDCDHSSKKLYIPVLTMPYYGGSGHKYEIICDNYPVCSSCALMMKPVTLIEMHDWEIIVNAMLRDGLDVPDRSKAKMKFIPYIDAAG